MARVVVAMSGGVDSSVAAYLIKQQGHEVIGLFMKNWHDPTFTKEDDCPWQRDSRDALLVAQHLNIPFQVVDLSQDYYHRIVSYMFEEYREGRTPNPDVLCNREIKFDAFWQVCQSLSADYIATGHYCRKDKKDTHYRLLRGKDPQKDQSYFLCQLSQEQLAHALFPVGTLQKSQVRNIARDAGILVAKKKDSQGLCFVGKIKLPVFLSQKLKPKEGLVLKVDSQANVFQKEWDEQAPANVLDQEYFRVGEEIGKHPGCQFFTIGQRKGLHIGGYKKPLFVIHIDSKRNIVYVGEGVDHKGLYKRMACTKTSGVNWLIPALSLEEQNHPKEYLAQVRYRQKPIPVSVQVKRDYIYTYFQEPCFAVARGQFLVWYLGDQLIGSGVIEYAL